MSYWATYVLPFYFGAACFVVLTAVTVWVAAWADTREPPQEPVTGKRVHNPRRKKCRT
jgi:hypothetical protein